MSIFSLTFPGGRGGGRTNENVPYYCRSRPSRDRSPFTEIGEKV